MPRLSRVVAVGVPHHITQRGNRKQDIFFCDEDRKQYLELLTEYSGRYGLDVFAYCLMSNHVHIVGCPNSETSLARTIQMTHMRYTQAVNKSKGWSGHLWESRFYSTMLDERHLQAAALYVELNPVRAGMVKQAEDYPWSSAVCHCGLRDDPVLTGGPTWGSALEDWPELLRQMPEEETTQELRACTAAGKPCGDEEFVAHMSVLVGRPLTQRPAGRPRLSGKEETEE